MMRRFNDRSLAYPLCLRYSYAYRVRSTDNDERVKARHGAALALGWDWEGSVPTSRQFVARDLQVRGETVRIPADSGPGFDSALRRLNRQQAEISPSRNSSKIGSATVHG